MLSAAVGLRLNEILILNAPPGASPQHDNKQHNFRHQITLHNMDDNIINVSLWFHLDSSPDSTFVLSPSSLSLRQKFNVIVNFVRSFPVSGQRFCCWNENTKAIHADKLCLFAFYARRRLCRIGDEKKTNVNCFGIAMMLLMRSLHPKVDSLPTSAVIIRK